MKAMKPQRKEEEETVELTPEEEAMLDAACDAEEAGDFVEVEIVDGRLREVRRPN
jgi:hypothetical protein